MKINFGLRTILDGSPILVADWLKSRIKKEAFDFPLDATLVEGDWNYNIPATCSEEKLTEIINIVEKLQKQYLINQLSKIKKAGEYMTITYKMVTPETVKKGRVIPGHIRIVEKKVSPGLDYNKMKYASPKGFGLPSKKQEWDNSFQIHIKSSNEDRSVFINVYDSEDTHTPEHLTNTMLRLPVTYTKDKDGNIIPTKSKTTYYDLEGNPLSSDKKESVVSSKTGYIDTVFSIYIDKILSLTNKSIQAEED